MTWTLKSPSRDLSIPKDQGSVPRRHRPFFVANPGPLTWHSRFCYSVINEFLEYTGSGLSDPQAEQDDWIVAYGDGTSNQGHDGWPPEADGQGASPHRVLTAPYGNSADSWFAGPPTPGF